MHPATTTRTSRAFPVRQAVELARERVLAARRAVLVAEAGEQDRIAASTEENKAALRVKIDALLGQIETLDGVRYEPPSEPESGAVGSRSLSWTIPRTVQLDNEAALHRHRASVLRYVAQHDVLPVFVQELDVPAGSYGSAVPADLVVASARDHAEWCRT